MDPLTAGLIIGGGAQIISNIFGASAASEQAEKAEKLINDAIARVQALPIPDITKKIIYDQYISVGDFSPQMLDKVIEENAPLALVKEDPRYRAKMEATLARQEQATTGPTAQARLGYEEARRKTAQDVLAQMADIESAARRTGTFSGGATLAAKMKAAQAAADRSAMENLRIAGQQEQQQAANLESFIRNLSADQASQMATQTENVRARNLRDELLMRNAMAREQANKQAMNQANLRNLQERQRAYDANIGTNIQEQRRIGYEAPMQMFNMQLNKINSQNQLTGNLANTYMGRGQAAQQAWSNIGSGAMGLASTYGLASSYNNLADKLTATVASQAAPSLVNMTQSQLNSYLSAPAPNASFLPGYGPQVPRY